MVGNYGRLCHAAPRLYTLQHPRTYISLQDLGRAKALGTISKSNLSSGNRNVFSAGCHGNFSTLSLLRYPQRDPNEQDKSQGQKKKPTRSPTKKTSLRRVAVEAQRSRGETDPKKSLTPEAPATTKTVTAFCSAEQYDIPHAAQLLLAAGHQLDPYGTKLFPQMIHATVPVDVASGNRDELRTSGDVFVFPSGTVVGWGVSDELLSNLVSKTLLPSAQSPHLVLEEEDLEYLEDPTEKASSIRGDTIILGIKAQTSDDPPPSADSDKPKPQTHSLNTVLVKIAFSSGLARSTKLAVLESSLSAYMASTRTIPTLLSRGETPFTRSFILQKTGQLLTIRAQLNLYSELTDSLPDIFWDSRHELGLESYFGQAGRALDIHTRIKTLNERMDYASEIAGVLREQLSGQHGTRLEWIIIVLITVEVVFGFWDKVKDFQRERGRPQGGVNDVAM